MNLDAIGIVSQDMQKSIKFYNLLGLAFKQAGGPDHYEAVTKTGLRVMLDSEALMKKLNSSYVPGSGQSIVLGFVQESVSGVDKAYLKIVDAGFESITKPWDAFWGQRYASVKDPDGNQIDLFCEN